MNIQDLSHPYLWDNGFVFDSWDPRGPDGHFSVWKTYQMQEAKKVRYY